MRRRGEGVSLDRGLPVCDDCGLERYADMETEAGAVLFTVNMRAMTEFYGQGLGMSVHRTADDHVVLGHGPFRLILHRIPERHARDAAIAAPPVVRERGAVKLSFRHQHRQRSPEGGQLRRAGVRTGPGVAL